MSASNPIVTVKQGQLCGKIDSTDNGIKYCSFQAIPYAKPPLGSLRFKAPEPPVPWSGVREAKNDSTPCYNKNLLATGIVEGDEDCLFLNVFTPEISETSLKPVMVFIHGGGFVCGDNRRDMYDPEYLIRHGIVLVNINYRTGALGFLSLEDKSLGVPGNAGLKDQVMALKWIQENIKKFGGDPNNVTIFGESAGGASVHFLILSPMAKGLFHKAIMQSGTSLCPWSLAKKCGYLMVENLGKHAKNDKEVLGILQGISKEELLEAQLKFKDDLNPSELRCFAPVVEGDDTQEPSFLPDEPLNLLKAGKYNKVPMIFGYTSNEGLCFDTLPQITTFNSDLETQIPWNYNIPKNSQRAKEIAQRIEKFYYGNDKHNPDNVIYNKILSDNLFVRDIYKTMEMTLSSSNVDVYHYQFSFEGKLNMLRNMLSSDKAHKKGACHADDLGYLFKIKMLPPLETNSKEELIIKRMTTWWTNFAKYGNPNAKTKIEQDLLQTTWPKLSKNDIKCLDINEKVTILNDPERKYLDFWKSLEGIAAH